LNDHDDSFTEDLGAYVLDALEPSEREAFEAHLRMCAQCQTEVAELLPVVDALPLAVTQAEPSSELKTRLMSAIADDGSGRPSLVPMPGGAPARDRRPLLSRGEALLGLVAAVIIAALGIWNHQLQNQIDSQKQNIAYQQNVNRAILSGASVNQLSATSSGSTAQASVVQPKDGSSPYLLVGNLPAVSGNKVFELWYIRGTSPSPVKVFRYSGNAPAIVPVSQAAESNNIGAITIEPGPNGSKAPTTKPILAGKFKI
jgi:anti-sigma factor RsiW